MGQRGLPIMTGRINRIATFADAGRLAGHGTRTIGDLRHVDPALTSANSAWGCEPTLSPFDLTGQIKACAKKQNAEFRQSAAVAFELLVTGTDEAWAIGGAKLRAAFPERIKAIAERLYGEGCVAAIRVDRDEPSGGDHGSVFVVPVIESRTKTGRVKRAVSVRRATGGESKPTLSRHGKLIQDVVHAAFHDFGMRRGVPSERRHIPPAEYRRLRAWEEAVLKREIEADQKLEFVAAAITALEESRQSTSRYSDHVRRREEAAEERWGLADLAKIAADHRTKLAQEAEQAARITQQRSKAAEEAAHALEKSLKIRETKIAEREQEAEERLVALAHGIDAFLDNQAVPGPKPGQWEIIEDIPPARRKALTGRFGIQVWRWAALYLKGYAAKIDALFETLALTDAVLVFAQTPLWNERRRKSRTHIVTPLPSAAADMSRTSPRP